MIQIITIVAAIAWALMEIITYHNGEITIAPIKGLMVGALYNNDVGSDDTEHTVQILFFVFSINFIWITE